MRGIAKLTILGTLVAIFTWQAVDRFYAYDAFASVETRQSLEVTEAQTAELIASRIKSDLITFGVIGALLAALAGSGAAPGTTLQQRGLGGAIGIVIGGIFGAMAGYLGNLHDANVAFPSDPTFYWVGRWALLFGLMGVAAGIAAGITAGKRLASDAVVGSLIGAGIAILLYCFLSGSITPNESHENVLPGHSGNRLLMLLDLFVVIPTLIAVQLLRSRARITENTDQDSPEIGESAGA